MGAAAVHGGLGLLLAAISIPLVLRRIPMNRGYGVRIQEAFLSDAHWYDINAYGGRLFLVYGVLLTAFAVLTRDLEPPKESPWSPVFIVTPLLLIVLLVIPIHRYARRRARGER